MAPLPLGRLLAQVIVPIIATLARALPAAYNQALQNARKGGVHAASSKAASGSMTKRMHQSEALQVLNIPHIKEATPELIQEQYQRYFEANAVSNGGSFYLQSKIVRAKELLDDYVQEQHVHNSNDTGESRSSSKEGEPNQSNQDKEETKSS